jgi:outer membrane receptor protein involved in Fe transport
MKRHATAGASVMALMIAVGAGSAARAADANATTQASGAEVEEIIVHARLKSEALTKSPVVVTAVTGEELARQGITDMTQLSVVAPNIKIGTGFLLDTFSIRGIGSGNENPGFEQQVGLFIDGAYYGNGHWITGAYVDLSDVEVAEGPQGVHLGKNTIAGALIINTKDPGAHFEGYIKGGYEAYAAQRYVEAAVSGPITDTFAARLVMRYDKMEGWLRNYVTDRAEPGTRDIYGRLTLVWKPTSNFDANIKLSADNNQTNGPFSQSTTLYCAGPNNTPGPYLLPQSEPGGGLSSCLRDFTVSTGDSLNPVGGLTGATHAYTYEPAYTMTANLHWRQSFGELTSTTAWSKYKFKAWSNSGTTEYPDGTAAVPGEANNSNETWSEELRYQTTLNFPVNVLVGLWYQHTDFTVFQDNGLVAAALNGVSLNPAVPSTGPIWDTNSPYVRQPGESKAIFGEIQWAVTPTIEVDAGVRASLEKKWWHVHQLFTSPFGQTAFGLFPTGTMLNNTNSEHNESPSVTVTWRPNSDFMAYGSFKTGFLSGGFSDTGPYFAPPNYVPGVSDPEVGRYTFGPEKVIGGEGGFKFFLANRTAEVNIDGFYYEYTGLQVNTFDPVTLSFHVQNAGKVIDTGVELSGRWNVGGGFSLAGQFTYNDSYYAEFIGSCLSNLPPGDPACTPTGQNFAGTPTDGAPRWSGRVSGEYTHTYPGDWVLHAGVGVDFSDKYLFAQLPAQPDAYAKVDAQISVDHDHWTAAIIGQNLNNLFQCFQVAGRTLAADYQELQCGIDRGRQIRMEATYRF